MKKSDVDAPRPEHSQASSPREHSIERLLSLLENATEGSRELDAHVFCAVAHPDKKPQRNFFYQNREEWGVFITNAPAPGITFHDAPAYTTSLDAALTLVPEGWEFTTLQKNGYGRWFAQVCDTTRKYQTPGGGTCVYAEHGDRNTRTNKYLALVIAALRARAAK